MPTQIIIVGDRYFPKLDVLGPRLTARPGGVQICGLHSRWGINKVGNLTAALAREPDVLVVSGATATDQRLNLYTGQLIVIHPTAKPTDTCVQIDPTGKSLNQITAQLVQELYKLLKPQGKPQVAIYGGSPKAQTAIIQALGKSVAVACLPSSGQPSVDLAALAISQPDALVVWLTGDPSLDVNWIRDLGYSGALVGLVPADALLPKRQADGIRFVVHSTPETPQNVAQALRELLIL